MARPVVVSLANRGSFCFERGGLASRAEVAKATAAARCVEGVVAWFR